jgi:hypothetical protein
MEEVSIQPFDCTQVKTATGFRVEIQELTLFQSVRLRVELLNESGNLIELKFVVLEGDDYMNWNNDDSYVLKKVAEKLGLQIIQ